MGVDFGGRAVGIGLLNYNEIHENTGCTSTMPHQLPKCIFLGGSHLCMAMHGRLGECHHLYMHPVN